MINMTRLFAIGHFSFAICHLSFVIIILALFVA